MSVLGRAQTEAVGHLPGFDPQAVGLELEEKFNLPVLVLHAKSYREIEGGGSPDPFDAHATAITSIHFASRHAGEIRAIGWDLVVIDEAHKLRNAYRESNRMGQSIRWAIEDQRKILLTATPLQNSLIELYGLSTVIDEHIFGDLPSFRTQYVNWARGISVDTKARALHKALEIGFGKMAEMDAAQKAVVFTESRRTQQYGSRGRQRAGRLQEPDQSAAPPGTSRHDPPRAARFAGEDPELGEEEAPSAPTHLRDGRRDRREA